MPHEISIAFQTNKTPAEYITLARQVNQYDFDVVSVYCDAPFHPSYAPLMLMAPHIERARLGPAAVSPSRITPIDIAAQTALLAQVAPGGAYIGVARGAWLEAHGITELQPPVQAIREAIDIVRYLLAGKTDGYTGEVFQIAEHVKATYPLPEMPIPLMVGSWGPKLCAVAGELADEVKIGGTANPDVVPLIQQYIADGEHRVGRDPNSVGVVVGAVTVVDEDRDRARQAAREAAALYLPVVAKLDKTLQLDPELVERIHHHADRHEYVQAGDLISDDLLDRFAFSGTPTDIIHQAEALFAAGTRRIEFGTPQGLNAQTGIDLIGKQIIPALKGFST
jgi:5,10-methylenetetrahydromethanopterin reductase